MIDPLDMEMNYGEGINNHNPLEYNDFDMRKYSERVGGGILIHRTISSYQKEN